MSITSNRREREKAQRREDILQAARQIFLENGGPFRATIDDVASRAEVSKGTVYLYFESKETILALLLLEGLDALSGRFEKAYAPRKSMPASKRLGRLGDAYFQFCNECPAHFRLMTAFDHGQFRERVPADLYQQIFDSSKRALQYVADVIQQGIDDDEFNVTDAWHTTGVLWASINGVLLMVNHPLRRDLVGVPVQAMFQQTLDILLNGIRKA